MAEDAYPLCWPDGWPRTLAHDRAWSLGGSRLGKWNTTVDRLMGELERLGAINVTLSTNQPPRKSDGLPYATTHKISDPGAAVYFQIGERALVMAQGRYELLIDNIRSLVLAVEGLRQMDRHGGAVMMERAFSGFQALAPAVVTRDWWEVLGVTPVTPLVVAEAAYEALAKERHPDAGGSDSAMAELNRAWDQAKAVGR